MFNVQYLAYMQIHLHTIFISGDRSVNTYTLPQNAKWIKELINKFENEPQPKDIYYREWFKVEPIRESELINLIPSSNPA